MEDIPLTNQTERAAISSATGKLSPPPHRIQWGKNLVPYLFLLPYMLAMLAFGLGPGIYALMVSFSDFSTGLPDYFAAGFSNYVTVFEDTRINFTFTNIAEFLIISVPLGIAFVILLAVLLQMRPGRSSTVLRTVYFIAGAITGPALVLLAIFMFDPTMSPFSLLLRGMGFNVLNDVIFPESLPVIFTVVGFFSGAGMWIAIQYGALDSISTEMLEAAKIDGCNAWQQALYIKLPIIRPYIIYQFILIFAGNVQLFTEPQILGSNSNVGVGANVPMIWAPNQLAYNFAFELGNFGASSALSLVMLLIGVGAAYLVIRWTGFFNIEK